LHQASSRAQGDVARAQALSHRIMQRVIEHGLSTSGSGLEERQALLALADGLDQLRGPVDPLTLWLRAQSLSLLEAAVEHQLLAVEALGESQRDGKALLNSLHGVLHRLREFRAEADELRARQPRLSQARLEALLTAVVGAVTNRVREALHGSVGAALAGDAEGSPAARLRPILAAFDGFDAEARQTHPVFEELLRGVTTELLWPVIERSLTPLGRANRTDYVASFDAVWTELAASYLARHVPLPRLLAQALSHAAEHDTLALGEARLPGPGNFSATAYAELRRALPRASLGYLSVQLCLRVDAGSVLEFAGKPELGTFARRMAGLPADLRAQLWQLDLKRVALSVAFFEGWLAQARLVDGARDDAFGLLNVLRQDQALARLRLETELTEALFPDAKPECLRLRGALDALVPALGQLVGAPPTG
jgi:hypothetical protein